MRHWCAYNPGVVDEYRRGFKVLQSLRADVLLGRLDEQRAAEAR